MSPRRSRTSLLLVVVALAIVALAAWRGPEVVERITHPLGHTKAIADAAAANGLDPYLVAAVINAESGFREGVVSNAGAVGLMQILPATAEPVAARIGIRGRIDADALSVPETNIRVGTAYLAELVARYDGSVELALAAYNAGSSNADGWAAKWRRAGGPLSASIGFPETARYVDEVAAQEQAYRRLYPDAFPDAGK